MEALDALEKILSDPSFAPNIVMQKVLEATDGVYAPFPEDLDRRIAASLVNRGISALYTHQARAWETSYDSARHHCLGSSAVEDFRQSPPRLFARPPRVRASNLHPMQPPHLHHSDFSLRVRVVSDFAL